MFKPTSNEELAIELLRKVARHWPKSLWLFAADGELCVMKKTEENQKATTHTGGMDPDYILAAIDIESDGGDW